jgi:hypothetical protein
MASANVSEEIPTIEAPEPDEVSEARAEQRSEANTAILTGAGLGAWGAFSAAALGAVCPLCVVVAPALLGYGAYKHYDVRKRTKAANDDE